MTSEADPSNHERYRFENDILTRRPALNETKLGPTKSRTDVEEFFSNFKNYLERVGGKERDNIDSCPFCNFELNTNNKVYETSQGKENFISTNEIHQRCWNDGYVLTYNPSGWHLVNEIFFPREHKNMKQFLNDDLKNILSHAYHRWERHQEGLKQFSINEEYYHALVVNFRYGQSVQHGHIHCYSSKHPRKVYDQEQAFIGKLKSSIGTADIQLVPFDHPRLNIEFDINFDSSSADKTSKIGYNIYKTGLATYESLFETEPPMCLGWFVDKNIKTCSFLLHPMQRRGTIQEFQTPIFQQFSTSAIVEAVRSEFSNVVSGTNSLELIY